MSYPELPKSLNELEEQVLARWREEHLFERTLEWTRDNPPFVFYEGPPTANGRPGFHHIIARTTKDLICRYRALTGRRVLRKAGWDTHGLPVEIEAEKKLGISGKPDIEAIGIERFNEVCRESVWTYQEVWEELSERIGYWLDYSKPYVTYHADYIESVWWILSELAGKGLLYRGHKSVPYCPRCGTALSSHEVAQGYEDVEDPSLYFLAPLRGEDGQADPDGRAFVVWTTTPWTVPSNAALAVHPDLTYVEVDTEAGPRIVAESRLAALFGEDAPVRARHRGADLVGTRYERPLDLIAVDDPSATAWTVVAEDFVSAEDGTGLVHIAPAFGADDFAAGQRYGLPLLRPIDDQGRFGTAVPVVGGLFVKDADAPILELLAERGRLFRTEHYLHSYPHCWRCRSPLIYMARDSWFAATSSLKDQLLANHHQIAWHPPEVGEGRFGAWLEGNVDWALSRDRFWGTPLPVWICDRDADHVEWIGSFAALADKAGPLPEPFDPHRPFIDEYTWPCACGGTMKRTTAVIDVWFDSGAMPYAQWHYPFENQDVFADQFPADYICEAMDQTRGWFYSLLAISTMLGKGPSFKNVIVNGLILDADGLKMSKSRGNVVDPFDAIAEHGADALRWAMMTVSYPWADKRYDPAGVADASRALFDTLLETYRFFALYANLEGWSPSDADPAPEARPVLDRWVLARLDGLVRLVRSELDGYQITRPYREVGAFVDDLSNWYVRRSRRRFWGNTDAHDTRAAFRTLHDALHTLALLLAPVTPFVADALCRALTGQSAHLTPFPESGPGALSDPALEEEMRAVRMLSRLGRAAREDVRIRVRQPLRQLRAVVPGGQVPRPDVLEVLEDELNVKQVDFITTSDGLVQVSAKPNYRVLGKRFQKRTEQAATAIRDLDADALRRYRAGEPVEIAVEGERFALQPGDLDVVEEAAGDYAVRAEGGYVAALDPTLDDGLVREGLYRELVNRVQRLRKDGGLAVSDRIRLAVAGPDDVRAAAEAYAQALASETLALDVQVLDRPEPGAFAHSRDEDLDGRTAWIGLEPVETG
ncbi:MAG: isoleucine--tRNA ligase [Gemmatimonadetes bacterium]|nr:isoleucine--tRNA ligase [Gemmatimonadota bacterium]